MYPESLKPEWPDDVLAQDIVTNTRCAEGARMMRDGAAMMMQCSKELSSLECALGYAITRGDMERSVHIFTKHLTALMELADARKAFREAQQYSPEPAIEAVRA